MNEKIQWHEIWWVRILVGLLIGIVLYFCDENTLTWLGRAGTILLFVSLFIIVTQLQYNLKQNNKSIEGIEKKSLKDINKNITTIEIKLQNISEQIENIFKNKKSNDDFLEKFTEFKFLRKQFETILLKDLLLDKEIKKNKIDAPHLFFLKIKFSEYYSNFFHYDNDCRAILDVPIYYFENKIWPHLIENSNNYYSVQRLTDDQAEYYIKNEDRLNRELNLLDLTIINTQSQFKKIFVLEDAMFENNNNNKIKDSNHKTYLQRWLYQFPESSPFQIKIAKKSVMDGLISEHKEVPDIGIFDSIFGIQQPRERMGKFCDDKIQIDFYFDAQRTLKEKNNFDIYFEKGIKLSKVL